MTSWLLLLICWVSCAPRDAVLYLMCFPVGCIYGLGGIAMHAASMFYSECCQCRDA